MSLFGAIDTSTVDGAEPQESMPCKDGHRHEFVAATKRTVWVDSKTAARVVNESRPLPKRAVLERGLVVPPSNAKSADRWVRGYFTVEDDRWIPDHDVHAVDRWSASDNQDPAPGAERNFICTHCGLHVGLISDAHLTGKPHPDSYRPDKFGAYVSFGDRTPRARQAEKNRYEPHLPLYSTDGLVGAWADRLIKAEQKGEPKTIIKKNAPHPNSYRPDLPMRGMTAAQLEKTPTATKEDKAIWAARPLTYATPEETLAWQIRYARTLRENYEADKAAGRLGYYHWRPAEKFERDIMAPLVEREREKAIAAYAEGQAVGYIATATAA